jgi:hypothetical protein
MAITIVEQPQTYTPLYNDIVTVLSSNQIAQPKFKYGLDVYVTIEGSGDSLIGRLKSPALSEIVDVSGIPTLTAYSYFNLKDILQGSNLFASK